MVHWGGRGHGGTIQIASWKCNFGIYLDIQAITTLLYLILVLYVLVPSIYSFFYLTSYNSSPEKWHFSAAKSLLLTQFSTYRHQTGFMVKRKQVHITNYLGLPINHSAEYVKYAKIFGDYFWLIFIPTEDLGDHFFLIFFLLKILATHSSWIHASWRSWWRILADFMPTEDLANTMETHSFLFRSNFQKINVLVTFKKRSCKGLPVWGLTKRGWYEMVWLHETQ